MSIESVQQVLKNWQLTLLIFAAMLNFLASHPGSTVITQSAISTIIALLLANQNWVIFSSILLGFKNNPPGSQIIKYI
jgi:hypothetical protein